MPEEKHKFKQKIQAFNELWKPKSKAGQEALKSLTQQKTIGQEIFDNFEAWYRKEVGLEWHIEIFEFTLQNPTPEEKIVELINKAFEKCSK